MADKKIQIAQSRLPSSDPDVQHMRLQDMLELEMKRARKLPHSDRDVTVKEIKSMSHRKGGMVRRPTNKKFS